MNSSDEINPLAITDKNVKRWVGLIFIFLAFVFTYALGWYPNYPIVKKIFIDKDYEYSYEVKKGGKTIEKTVGAESDLVQSIGYHHLRVGLIMMVIGVYFLSALFWMFKSRKRLIIATLIPLGFFVVIFLVFSFR